MRVCETCPPSHQRATFASHDDATSGGSRRARGRGRRSREALLRAADLLRDRAALRPAQPPARAGGSTGRGGARRSRRSVWNGGLPGRISIFAPARSTWAPRSREAPGFCGHIIGADFAEPMLRAGRGKASPAVLVARGRRRALAPARRRVMRRRHRCVRHSQRRRRPRRLSRDPAGARAGRPLRGARVLDAATRRWCDGRTSCTRGACCRSSAR